MSKNMTKMIAFHPSHYRDFKGYYSDVVTKYWCAKFPGPDVANAGIPHAAIGAGSFREYGVKLGKPNHPRKDFKMVKDPVCGMDVDSATATNKSEYKGKMYYFCSPGCKKDFDRDPEKYVKPAEHSHSH
jgi:YHS domain-containing protein